MAEWASFGRGWLFSPLLAVTLWTSACSVTASRWLFSPLLAVTLSASACNVRTSAEEVFFYIWVEVTYYSHHSPISPSIPLHCIAVHHHIIRVVHNGLNNQTVQFRYFEVYRTTNCPMQPMQLVRISAYFQILQSY